MSTVLSDTKALARGGLWEVSKRPGFVWREVSRCGIVEWNMDDVIVPEVPTMLVLDQVKCVKCGATEYRPAKGKASRTFVGVCKEHEKEVLGEAQETIPGTESKTVPARK